MHKTQSPYTPDPLRRPRVCILRRLRPAAIWVVTSGRVHSSRAEWAPPGRFGALRVSNCPLAPDEVGARWAGTYFCDVTLALHGQTSLVGLGGGHAMREQMHTCGVWHEVIRRTRFPPWHGVVGPLGGPAGAVENLCLRTISCHTCGWAEVCLARSRP